MPILLFLLLTVMLIPVSPRAESQRIDGIAAVVGEEIILQSELDAYAMLRKQQGAAVPPGEEGRKAILEELINGKILLIKAQRDSTISVSPDEVDQALQAHIAQILAQNNLTREQFENELAGQQGITFTEFKRQTRRGIREELLKQKIQQKYTMEIDISRSDVEAFYRQYRDSLPQLGESVKLVTLAVTVSPSDAVRQRAYTSVLAIKERLDNGESFSALMQSAGFETDGVIPADLGFVDKGSLREIEFENRAFALEPGEISDVFETRLGYHVVQAVSRRGSSMRIRQFFAPLAPAKETMAAIVRHVNSLARSVGTKEPEQLKNALASDSRLKVQLSRSGWIELSSLPAETKSRLQELTVNTWSAPEHSANRIEMYMLEEKKEKRSISIEDDWNLLSAKAEEIAGQQKLISLITRWRKEMLVDIRL